MNSPASARKVISAQEIRAVFEQEFDLEFMADTIRCLFSCYKAAAHHCKDNFPPEEAHDLLPIYRRALIEKEWRALAERYSNVGATTVANEIGSSYASRISAGRMILTACAVDSPGAMFRDAEFRKNLARDSQFGLFESPEALVKDPRYFGVLLHGPDALDRSRPAFANIAFPNAGCTRYIANLALFKICDAVVSSLTANQEEHVELEPEVRLKPQAKAAKHGA
jgi:hypothetical protein